MSTTDNSAVPAVRRLFAAFGSKDLSVIPEVVTDDFVDHGSPVPLPPGPEGYARILGFVMGVLEVDYEVQDMFWTEDRIVVRAVGHGRGLAAVHGEGADGKPFAMDTVHIFRTEGERLAEHWGIRDEFGARVQLGTLPPPRFDLGSAAPTS